MLTHQLQKLKNKLISFAFKNVGQDTGKFDISLLHNLSPVSRESKELILSFGAGRSGQRWLNRIFTSHQNCNGGCERFHEFEAYFRFVTWNKLPIDMEGFYDLLQKVSLYDWQTADISMQSSPYFAFGISPLVEKLNPNYLFFHLRTPQDVINSNYLKGWYSENYIKGDPDKLTGIQPLNTTHLHRSFGRILPLPQDWDYWVKLSRIGKITWYYKTINTHIFQEFQKHQDIKQWFVKLADIDQNYDYYRYLAATFNLKPVYSKQEYLLFKGTMKNKAKKRRSVQDWNTQEKKEFEQIIEPFMDIYDSIKTTGI